MDNDSLLRSLEDALSTLKGESYDDYWKGLGQFIDAFSLAENGLLSLLRKMVGVSNQVSGVLFSGTRSDSAKDHLNRILEVNGELEMKKRLERPLAQLSTIGTVRNHLVHWGARQNTAKEFVVSNAFLYPHVSRLKEFKITLIDMTYMCTDLFTINACFLIEELQLPNNPSGSAAFLSRPWLYTPPQPTPPSKKPPPHPPKR